MHDVLRAAVALAAAVAVAFVPMGVEANATTPIALSTGQSLVLQTTGLTRVAVGDGKIAGVVAIGTREVLVNGKTAGITTLFVWTSAGREDYVVTVTEAALEDLRRMIQAAITIRSVHVDVLANTIVLNGTVSDPDDLVQLSNIVARYQPVADSNKYALVDAVTVAHPMGALQGALASTPATANVTVERDSTGSIIVTGTVPDRITAQLVIDKVNALGGPYLSPTGKVIDRLQTATTSQVDVKVYVLEIDETGLKNLGVLLQSANTTTTVNSNGSSTITYTLGSAAFPFVEAPSTSNGKAFTIGSFFRSITLAPTLNLVIESSHARVLSSPDLVTMPGKKAEFLVGGEIPIPISTGPQQIAIDYKEYGVKLEVTPTILGNGNVETVIAPEVSNLDFADGVTLNGFVVPALKTSKLSTDVITKAGESIVMGGLLSHMETRTINKIPILGDLPILGPLFRSTNYQTSKTDVVFVMTPTILTR